MDLPQLLLRLPVATVALSAWVLVRRQAGHRWLAAYLSWMVVADFVRDALRTLRVDAPRPYVGLARLSFHLDQTVYLSWNFLFVALCVHYFLRARIWVVLVFWAVAAAICLDYPTFTRDTLMTFYKVVSALSLVASWSCILWGMLRHRDIEPSTAHLVLIFYASTDVALNLVPFVGDLVRNWPLVRLANGVNCAACTIVQLRAAFGRRGVAPVVS